MSYRGKWLEELIAARQGPRKLVQQDDDSAPWDRELCVICDSRTLLWLQPENAPICSPECLDTYLHDPTVYDPRELYTTADPAVLVPEDRVKVSKTKARRSRPGRWEPDDSWIRDAQKRIAKARRGDDD